MYHKLGVRPKTLGEGENGGAEKEGKGVKRLRVYCIDNCDLPIPFRR